MGENFSINSVDVSSRRKRKEAASLAIQLMVSIRTAEAECLLQSHSARLNSAAEVRISALYEAAGALADAYAIPPF